MAPETAAAAPRPFYQTLSQGQIRLWIAGAGANLVVLPGLIRSAEDAARRLAQTCPGWRIIAVEPPGVGYSAGVAPHSIESMTADIAASLAWLGDEPCVLLGYDLQAGIAARLAERLGPSATATLTIGAEAAAGWRRAGIAPPDLALRQDGAHLGALWLFLRDRHLLTPDQPSLPAAEGEPIPEVGELSDCFVCAAQKPERFAQAWRVCLDAAEERPAGTTAIAREAELAQALAAHHRLPSGAALPPPAEAAAGGAIWHDYAETAHGRLHLRRAGGEGEPLLVIPTGGGSSAQFAPVISGLARGRRVFAVDYPGNGLSFKPQDPVTTRSLAEDMLALLDAMEIESTDIWGSHTGSLVALEMAVLAPERVRRLVMEGPVFISPDFQDDLLANYFIDFTPDKWGLHLGAVWNWRRDMFMYWPWYRAQRDAVRQLGVPDAQQLHLYAMGILESGETYDRAYRSAFSYDTRSQLAQLTRPALICAGPNDQLKNALDEAPATAPEGLVSYAETPTTVWWPDPDPAAAQATLALYDRFLRGEAA